MVLRWETEVPSGRGGRGGQCWRAGASRAANSGFAASKETSLLGCTTRRGCVCVCMCGRWAGGLLSIQEEKSPDAVARLASSQRARRAATPTSAQDGPGCWGGGLPQLQLQADTWQVGRGCIRWSRRDERRPAGSRLKAQCGQCGERAPAPAVKRVSRIKTCACTSASSASSVSQCVQVCPGALSGVQ